MIRIEKVSKSFGEQRILHEIELRLADEKTHVLLGASGSGKSTLLRMVMGLIHADQGKIWVGDIEMEPTSRKNLSRRIGYVLQDGGLFPHLSAADNVALVANTLGWSKEKIAARMNELLDIVGLDRSLLSRFPGQLSGGQRQRIGVMRAAFLDPQVMLLDEPLGALDPIVRSHLQQELKTTFAKLRKLVLIVTHDIAEAAFFGDTVTLLHQGRVLQHGSFSDLVEKPAHPYVTEFIRAQRSVLLKEFP